MTFVTGDNKITKIGPVPSLGGYNALEVILREAGRFIVRGDDEFIAQSEKKTRNITVTGAIGSTSNAEHFNEYDGQPVANDSQFESADMFPQDLLNEYPIDEIEIYGLLLLCDMSLSAQPADAIARLKGVHANYWISRQAITSWAWQDSIQAIMSAYQSLPENGLKTELEGIVVGNTKKKLVPLFVPIKSSFKVRKDTDKIFLYSDVSVLGYCAASTAGGTITGSCSIDHRFIIGMGFLPEEVEELLSPTQ